MAAGNLFPSAAVAAAAAAAAAAADSASDDSSPSPHHHASLLGPNASSLAGRRPPPPCWTDEETFALLDVYRDKWVVNRRKNLSAGDWDAVAVAVTTCCSRLPTSTPKTGAQCRHKLEKLRKRYRGERQRRLSRGSVSPWPFYNVLEELSGDTPVPAPHNPPTAIRISSSSNNKNPSGPTVLNSNSLPLSRTPPSSSSSEEGAASRRSLSLNHLLGNGSTKPVGSSSNINIGVNDCIPYGIPKASRSFKTGGKPLARPREEEGDADDAFGEVAAALQAFTEGFLRVEQRKMEMAKELERERMNAELKRTEMMLESQRLIVDSLLKRFLGNGDKRARVSHGDP